MTNKILSLFLIFLLIFIISNVSCYATDDILMDLDGNTTSSNDETVDNTIYTDGETVENPENSDSEFEYAAPLVNTDYDNSDEGLSVTNMINIIFIVVGIVLILLGIAIIIKLK